MLLLSIDWKSETIFFVTDDDDELTRREIIWLWRILFTIDNIRFVASIAYRWILLLAKMMIWKWKKDEIQKRFCSQWISNDINIVILSYSTDDDSFKSNDQFAFFKLYVLRWRWLAVRLWRKSIFDCDAKTNTVVYSKIDSDVIKK